MRKVIYAAKPAATEEVVSIGTRTTVIRFGITETDEGWECEESEFSHQDPLTEDDYGRLVSFLVGEKYSSDQMEALHNNFLLDPNAYKEDLAVMQAWRQEAKRMSVEVLGDKIKMQD